MRRDRVTAHLRHTGFLKVEKALLMFLILLLAEFVKERSDETKMPVVYRKLIQSIVPFGRQTTPTKGPQTKTKETSKSLDNILSK